MSEMVVRWSQTGFSLYNIMIDVDGEVHETW